MNKVFAAIAFVLAGNATAGTIDTITCAQYGYTSDPDNFADIPVAAKQSVFKVTGLTVSLEGKTYKVIDPEMVGLEGLAVVYKDSKNNQLLYLYMNDDGEKEIGVSNIPEDSDTFFGDKSVYKQCTLTEDKGDGSTESILRTAGGRISDTLPVYSF